MFFKEMKYQETEQEALEQEREELEWQKLYGMKADYYIAKIDQLLAEGTKESRMQIRASFLNKEFFEHYKQVDQFAIMYIVMTIYELEDDAKTASTILDQADTVARLQDYIFQFKMILYRLDFEIGQDTEKELFLFLKEHMVSPVQLEIIMNTTVMRPLTVALKLEEIFERHHLDDYLFFILGYIDKYWQGNYRIVHKMADIYRSAGRLEQAEKYQNKIPQIPVSFRGQEEILFQVQQLLWKGMYQELETEKEIALFLNHANVSDDMWRYLVENVNVSEKEYYLSIAEHLLKFNFVEKTEITLLTALQTAPGDELILCLLADLAINRGQIERAEQYLALVAKPGELTVKFQGLCKRLKEKNGNE